MVRLAHNAKINILRPESDGSLDGVFSYKRFKSSFPAMVIFRSVIFTSTDGVDVLADGEIKIATSSEIKEMDIVELVRDPSERKFRIQQIEEIYDSLMNKIGFKAILVRDRSKE